MDTRIIALRHSIINETRQKTQIASDISTMESPAEFNVIIKVDISLGSLIEKRVHGWRISVNVPQALLERLISYAANAGRNVINNSYHYHSYLSKTQIEKETISVIVILVVMGPARAVYDYIKTACDSENSNHSMTH